MRQAIWLLVGALALATFLAGFVLPGVALVRDAIGSIPPNGLAETFALGPRQWGLVGRGLWLALLGTAGAFVLGASLAVGFFARWRLRLLTATGALWILITPTYLLAYAWGLVALPEGLFTGGAGTPVSSGWLARDGRAVLCLATWLSPITAVALAFGWRTRAGGLFDLTVLDASALRAAWAAVSGGMRRIVGAAALFCFLLAITDYAIPHLCQAYTWNTELLAELQALHHPALLAAWPLITIAGVLLILCWFVWRSVATETPLVERQADAREIGGLGSLPALIVLLAPVALLLGHMRGGSALWNVWGTYRAEWLFAIPIGSTAALGCLALAVQICWLLLHCRGVLRMAGAGLLAILIIMTAMPPVVIGEGVLLSSQSMPWIRDSFLAISLCGVARFASVPAMALWASLQGRRDLVEQAEVDGASLTAAYLYVLLPQAFPLLAACGVCCGLLAATEIGATQLVSTPGVSSLAQTMLNEIHFGRDDQIIAMSLWMMAFCGFAAVGIALASKKRKPLRNAER